MVSVYQEKDRVISKRVFCVEVTGVPRVLDEALCEGILKRVFSKQICFTYMIEGFEIFKSSFRIHFRFVCWNADGQTERYRDFKHMDQSKLEENVKKHSGKTIDMFVGEFFKRLKKKNFEVTIDGKQVDVFEVNGG